MLCKNDKRILIDRVWDLKINFIMMKYGVKNVRRNIFSK